MLSFKKDIYSTVRNSYSRRMNLHCYKCNYIFATYQKDGPWNLRRLYFDRIMSPSYLKWLEKQDFSKIPTLKCPWCDFIIAEPTIYEKEDRPCFRIYQDAVIKRVRPLKS